MQGKIVRLVSDKGFGFINSGGIEYFFHKSTFSGHWADLVVDISEKNEIAVQFEEVFSNKGPRAENVRRLDFPN